MDVNIKFVFSSIIIILLIQLESYAQTADSILIKKLSVNGICLCNTTLSYLKQSNIDLKETEVEEMDMPKNCYGQDSRYIAGKGYSSYKYPGMIFQKDQTTDQISKIRLTRTFVGRLPDGTFVNLNNLTLKELFTIYPKLKGKWGSRDCSDYWNFSNDTISFYLKIDKAKQPQFPIDESYYADKKIDGVDLVTSCYRFGQQVHQESFIESAPNDPLLILDGIAVNRRVLQNFVPSEIASLTVYKGAEAIKRGGAEAKNGLIYIETKKFAKQCYWTYFKSKSSEFLKIVPNPQDDSSIQYILNAKILKDNFESDLSAINDKTFKSIAIIDGEQLKKDYGIMDKRYGVIILSEISKNSKK